MIYKDLGNGYYLHVSLYRSRRVYFQILHDTGRIHWLSKKTIYHVVHFGKAMGRTGAERKAMKWMRKTLES